MKSLKEKIEIMEAALCGKVIESISLSSKNALWATQNDLTFSWAYFDYRIRQEPIELMIDVYEDGKFEISSAKNIKLYDGTKIIKRIVMREVI